MGGGNVYVVQTKVEWDQKLKEAGSRPVSTMSSAYANVMLLVCHT